MDKIIGPVGCGCIGLVVGVGMLIFGWFLLGKQQAVQNYKPVQGEVLSSEVSEKQDEDGKQYSPDIVYTYTVDGKEYESDSYYYADVSTSNRDWAEKAVEDHPEGSEITVYYSPEDPEASVLVKDTEKMGFLAWVPYIMMGIGGASLLVPLGMLVYGGLLVWVIRQGSKRSQDNADTELPPGSDR